MGPYILRGTTAHVPWMQQRGPPIPRLPASKNQGNTTTPTLPSVMGGNCTTGRNSSTTRSGTIPDHRHGTRVPRKHTQNTTKTSTPHAVKVGKQSTTDSPIFDTGSTQDT